MYCVKCGTELSEGTMFCGQCGTPVQHVESPSVQKDAVKDATSMGSASEEQSGNAQERLAEVITIAKEKSMPFLKKGKELISDYKRNIQENQKSGGVGKSKLVRKIIIGLFAFVIIILLLGIWASSGNNGNNSSSYESSDEYSTSGSGYCFTSPQSVMDYVVSRTFECGSTKLRVDYDGVYANGTWTLAAPTVVEFNSTRAMLVATSPYSRRQSRFIVDCEGNYIKDCNSNDYYYSK